MNQTTKRIAVIVAWASAAVGWIVYQRSTGLGATGALQEFIDVAGGAWWALLAFFVVYAIRPLVLFPASLLTIGGGVLFGPVVGVAATVAGANASAMVAYWLARSLGFQSDGYEETRGLLSRWSARMRSESFTTVMVMRLAFLPYDLVNYAAGLLRIRPISFLAATAIGSLPGTIAFTLAGASVDRIEDGAAGVNPTVLLASVTLFVVSVGVAQYVKRSQGVAVAAGN
ncbi:MAG: TVP38/TMEM64 family protein [Acidimicrobiia bacterium]|nr:TVP38/TMEM64 family protein [Acidimicrobiia bacterium]